ncbi:hypothetical protein CI109_101975 [Kwoniella shandongensis]|uniref:Uncharacterized protein n=1 Tax=Kwoniella shandongensis TaxID=1734106 RepID=A0A5M6BTR2_9TREE|nr:uncharacterized protein CI109_005362 [Kwoniella shandongensis]KAA5526238.1 hypothetical protein CI109_005362 [Kwoniella shandongensis]
MPSPTPRHNNPSSSSPSPSRPPETQIEILYNTSVQSFVRRDHIKTQTTLKRLLDLLRSSARPKTRHWYDLDRPSGVVNGTGDEEKSGVTAGSTLADEEWLIKTLKLMISSSASLYTDPPTKTGGLPSVLLPLLPPASPERLLDHLYHVCVSATSTSTSIKDSPSVTDDALLPPQLLSTLILASLKLRPLTPALNFAHTLVERWLTALPDSFILSISSSTRPTKGGSKTDPAERKRVDSAREGYMKVVELFVGEVLAREGEWEMARGLLDGEMVMGSKRKEALYRHLRSLQSQSSSQAINPAPSPSSSLVLPSSADPTSPSPTMNGGRPRSRSGSSSSVSTSSSEATARPGPAQGQISGLSMGQINGKGKEKVPVDEDVDRVNRLNGRNPPASTNSGSASSTSAKANTMQSLFISTLSYLPPSLATRIRHISSTHPYLLSLPLPIILLLPLLIRLIRRRQARGRVPSLPTPTSHSAANPLTSVRARLDLARAQAQARRGGWWAWIGYYLRWWMGKFAGVWRLGTTITYV